MVSHLPTCPALWAKNPLFSREQMLVSSHASLGNSHHVDWTVKADIQITHNNRSKKTRNGHTENLSATHAKKIKIDHVYSQRQMYLSAVRQYISEPVFTDNHFVQ